MCALANNCRHQGISFRTSKVTGITRVDVWGRQVGNAMVRGTVAFYPDGRIDLSSLNFQYGFSARFATGDCTEDWVVNALKQVMADIRGRAAQEGHELSTMVLIPA